jgi:AcrR family transcriptional regulator
MTTIAADLDPPTSRRRAEIASRIEMAGLELFRDRGVEAVTVEDIAKAAGISRRTFYRYFDTAEAILTAFPLRSLRRLSRDVRQRPASESLREAFLAAVAAAEPLEGREMLPLMAAIAARSPLAFGRAMAGMEPVTQEFFGGMIRHRLRLMGEDESRAPLMAAVLRASIERTTAHFNDAGLDIGEAFDWLARMLSR